MSTKQLKKKERGTLISEMLNSQLSHVHQKEEEKKQSPKVPSQHIETKTPNLSSTIQVSDRQLSTISNIQSSASKVKRQLNDLIEQYKQSAEKMLLNHGWDPQKEAQIRNHLKKLQKQKKERRAKFQEDLKRLEEKKKALNQSTVTNNPDRQEKRASIQKRINAIHDRQKKRQEQQVKFMKFYQQYKAKKPKHKVLEEQFNEKQRRQKQEKVMKHKKKLSEVYKPMNLEQLEEFQEKYMNNKYQAEKQRLQNQLYQKKQQEANRQRLNQLYKGHCHSLVLQELAQQHDKSNEAKQRYKRIRQYSQLVKEEYQPRAKSGVDSQESQEDGMIPKTERGKRIVKDRYLKGQYLGKMVSYQKQSLSHDEQVSKGLQYLQYLKSLPKKPKKEEKLPPMPPIKPKSGVYKFHRQENPLYRASRRYNSIDLSVREGDSNSVNRVLEFMRHRQEQLKLDQKKLRHHSYKDRGQWQKQQKSFNSELVSNIEEKLQILKRM